MKPSIVWYSTKLVQKSHPKIEKMSPKVRQIGVKSHPKSDKMSLLILWEPWMRSTNLGWSVKIIDNTICKTKIEATLRQALRGSLEVRSASLTSLIAILSGGLQPEGTKILFPQIKSYSRFPYSLQSCPHKG